MLNNVSNITLDKTVAPAAEPVAEPTAEPTTETVAEPVAAPAPAPAPAPTPIPSKPMVAIPEPAAMPTEKVYYVFLIMLIYSPSLILRSVIPLVLLMVLDLMLHTL